MHVQNVLHSGIGLTIPVFIIHTQHTRAFICWAISGMLLGTVINAVNQELESSENGWKGRCASPCVHAAVECHMTKFLK